MDINLKWLYTQVVIVFSFELTNSVIKICVPNESIIFCQENPKVSLLFLIGHNSFITRVSFLLKFVITKLFVMVFCVPGIDRQ